MLLIRLPNGFYPGGPSSASKMRMSHPHPFHASPDLVRSGQICELISTLNALPNLPTSLRNTFLQIGSGWLVVEAFPSELRNCLAMQSPEIFEILYAIAGEPSPGSVECEILSAMERPGAIYDAFEILCREFQPEELMKTVQR